MINTFNSYELSGDWFNFCFEHPDIISPNDTALYFFIIEHCNRMAWKDKFGFPMQMAMDAIGIRNYKTYAKSWNNLIEWGFIKIYQKSKNQYSANIIGLVKNTKATSKALPKARQKHNQKQVRGIVGIDKQYNNIEPNNNVTREITHTEEKNIDVLQNFQNFKVTPLIIENFLQKNQLIGYWAKISGLDAEKTKHHLAEFLEEKETLEKNYLNIDDLKSHITNWFRSKSFNVKVNRIDTTKKIDQIEYKARPGEKVY